MSVKKHVVTFNTGTRTGTSNISRCAKQQKLCKSYRIDLYNKYNTLGLYTNSVRQLIRLRLKMRVVVSNRKYLTAEVLYREVECISLRAYEPIAYCTYNDIIII